LISADDRAKLKRIAIVSVRYVPGRSEEYAKSRSLRGIPEAGAAVGFTMGMGAAAVTCVPMAVIPPAAAVCFATLGLVLSGVGSLAGENIAKSAASPAQARPLGNHVTVAAELAAANNSGPDVILREQLRRSMSEGSGPAVSILDIHPHPAVEVN
jgi:hypothetical protein